MKNILKKILSLGICSAMVLGAFSGCGQQPGGASFTGGPSSDNSGSVQFPESSVPSESPGLADNSEASKSTASDRTETLFTDASGYTDFAVRLLQESLESEKNTLISPLSVINALAMTANGARGETLAQMESLLGGDISSLSEYLHDYNASLPSGEKYCLHSANSVWIRDREDFTVEESFLQNSTDLFGAEIYRAVFDDSTLQDINQWVARSTDEMIPEILREISPNAVMYLINALAFDAEWQSPYTSYQVRDAVFHMEDGSEKDMKLMHSEETILLQDIAEQNRAGAIGFLKYYAGEKYAFAALLPDEGVSIRDYVQSLTGERLRRILENASEANIDAALPKFEAEYSVKLNDILKSLGMTDAFDPDTADFSGISSCPGDNLYISQVLHKTYIAVDEQGTKAGAATAIGISERTVLRQEIVRITLDRPFVYMIIDCEENLPVFIGTVLEP